MDEVAPQWRGTCRGPARRASQSPSRCRSPDQRSLTSEVGPTGAAVEDDRRTSPRRHPDQLARCTCTIARARPRVMRLVLAGLGIGAWVMVVRSACVTPVSASHGGAARFVDRPSRILFAHAFDHVHLDCVFGVLRSARWAFHHSRQTPLVLAEPKSPAATQDIAARLRWLWQVMPRTASAKSPRHDRSASADRQPAIPFDALDSGGSADLGACARNAHRSLARMDEDRARHADTLAGDPIIDTAGRFEGSPGWLGHHRIRREGALDPPANVDVLSGLPTSRRGRHCAARPARLDRQQCSAQPGPRPRRLQPVKTLRSPQGRPRCARGRQRMALKSAATATSAYGRRRVRDRRHRREKPPHVEGMADRIINPSPSSI